MADFILQKKYMNHFGVDQKSSDLTRQDRFASDLLNVQFRKSGSLEKRKGYQGNAASQGGFGLVTYNRINPTTNEGEAELLAIDSKLYKSLQSSLTVTYSGAETTVLISIFYDSSASEYKCQILEGASLVLDQGLGLGFDEASPYTIDQLRGAIDALTDFAAVLSGATSTPAAFIDIIRDHDLSSSGSALTRSARYWSEVNSPIASPFAGSETNKNDLDFENVSSVQLNNVMFFANGYDNVLKYDGQNVYRAGVPKPSSITSALGGAGAVTGTNYFHLAQMVQIDAVGNVVEGNFLKVSTGLAPTAQSMDVTVANVVAASGFNTNCAIVAGAQVTVNTITVDDGSGGTHTMKAGDTAYFFDSVTGDYITRNVTSVTATDITVAGAAVTVADNAVISNNLRIAIYRNATSATTPTVFFLVEEIPNDSFSATQVFNDNVVDASLGAQFVEPLTDRSPPPKGKYISSFRNQAVIAGDLSNQNRVYWSDVLSPEYWPTAVNTVDINTVVGDVITGIAPNNEIFAVFKEKSIHSLNGDIANNNIRVDQITNDIGCVAHASIKEIRGALFFLSDLGPRQMAGGQVPVPLGAALDDPNASRIDPSFEQLNVTSDEEFRLKRAVALNNRLGEKYWLYVPAETVTSGDRHSNSFSRLFVFDHTRDAWVIWDNINMAGGATELGDQVFWSERRYSTFNSSVDHILYKMHDLNDSFDYADNNAAISWNFKSHWEALGEPSVNKKLNLNKLFNLEQEVTNNNINLTVKTEKDYIKDVTANEYSITQAGGGYGVSAYGTSPYGDPAEGIFLNKVKRGKFKSIRIIYENSVIHQNVIITGWELEFVAPFRAQFKS